MADERIFFGRTFKKWDEYFLPLIKEEDIESKFIATYASSFDLLPHQIPIDIDGENKFVLQILGEVTTCLNSYNLHNLYKKEFSDFLNQYNALTNDELEKALTINSTEVTRYLENNGFCVGCRTSVESMMKTITNINSTATLPLNYKSSARTIFLDSNTIHSPQKLFLQLHYQGPLYMWLYNKLTNIKKNRRCAVHSLDSQKTNPSFHFTYVWDRMCVDCRINVTEVPEEAFRDALQQYLHRHRFCGECRNKMEKVLDLFLGDDNSVDDAISQEFNPKVFQGLRVCRGENGSLDRHIHVDGEDESLIESLMVRAEAEMYNTQRERHAKTLEVAQGEVLTCLAVYLQDKLHRFNQKMRSEEHGWLLLNTVSLLMMKNYMDTAVDEKKGYSQLDLFCWEYEQEEKLKMERKEHKREKKKIKKKKAKKPEDSENQLSCNECGIEGGFSSPILNNHSPVIETPQITSQIHNINQSDTLSSSTTKKKQKGKKSTKINKNSNNSECPSSNNQSTNKSASICDQFEFTKSYSNCLCDATDNSISGSTCRDCGVSQTNSSPCKGSVHSSPSSSGRSAVCSRCLSEQHHNNNRTPCRLSTSPSSAKYDKGDNTSPQSANSSLCKLCLCDMKQSLLEGLHSTDGEDEEFDDEESIPDDLAELQANLPQLKKLREEYREQLRKKWTNISNSVSS